VVRRPWLKGFGSGRLEGRKGRIKLGVGGYQKGFFPGNTYLGVTKGGNPRLIFWQIVKTN